MARILSAANIPTPAELLEDLKSWIRERGLWWAASITAHAMILSATLLVLGTVVGPRVQDDAPLFDARIDAVEPDSEIEHFELGDAPQEPTELSTDTLLLDTPTVSEQVNTSASDPFEEAGGGSGSAATNFGGGEGFEIKGLGPGPALKAMGGLGGQGQGKNHGSGGGNGSGFGSRGSGVRKAMLGNGGTRASERAVAAALNWIARHQFPDGKWSLKDYPKLCKDKSCTHAGLFDYDEAATAMALLPFLASGQTHKTKGPYQKNIYAGLYWLIRHQKNDGDLAPGQTMYSHGLASICLCEAYGLTGDPSVGGPAQQALNYIVKAQNTSTGGWHYAPQGTGDTSVVGWQVMALKSGMMAGLEVPSTTIEGAHKWFKSAKAGSAGGLFCYAPGGAATPQMTAVGLLCSQYLGMKREDPAMVEGVATLMATLPVEDTGQSVYYWYYATQVMHNLPGSQWDTWNRRMRKLLIDTQCKKGCAEGSWDPAKDPFNESGGRLMITSLAALTLEVYYRYLPLYQIDGQPGAPKPRGGLKLGRS